MAEESFPVVDQPMTDEQWKQVTLGVGSGILDQGGSPYWITDYDNASNTVSMRVSTTQGTANAILRGFYHRLDEAATLSVPAVTSTTTYWIALQYDPARVADSGLPVRLGVFKSLDRSQNKDYIILYRIVRKPNQLLTDAEVTIYRQRVAPTVTVYSRDRLPDPATVLWGTVAVAYGPEKSVYVCMSDGSADPMRWEPVAGDAAGKFSWDARSDSTSYASPPSTGGYARAIGRQGKQRRLRGRVYRISGADFNPGVTYNPFGTAPLDPEDRPEETQAFTTAISNASGGIVGNARVEVTPAGAVNAWVSAPCSWVSLDGVYWEVR